METPSWLAQTFPGHGWRSLRSCCVRVGGDGAAGLDLEACDFGYLVEAVESEPGQDPDFRPGSVIVAIDGVSLLALSEDQLEAAFASHLAVGATVLLVDMDELLTASCRSSAGTGANVEADGDTEIHAEAIVDIVLEHGSLLRVQVADIGERLAMSWEALNRDLAHFGSQAQVRVELPDRDCGFPFEVSLAGSPDDVQAARSELGALLRFHGVSDDMAKSEHDLLEVDGLVMHSLPARQRRRVPQRGKSADSRAERAAAAAQMVKHEVEKAVIKGRSGVPPSQLPQTPEVPEGKNGELRQFEYMDHTADVILHSWGRTLEEAFAQTCVAFFAYLTDLNTVDLVSSVEVEATGHDVLDLLYHLLDEFLFSFGTEFIVCRCVEITELDLTALRVRARGTGERFDLNRHPQGTEIKAITMHQMKILTPDSLTTEAGTSSRNKSNLEGGCEIDGFPYECFVLVDI